MKKILFGITGLTIGGAERVLVDLANELSKNYKITIFTLYAKGELEEQLDSNIELKSLYEKQYKELPRIKQKVIMPLKVLLFKKSIYNKKIKGNFDTEIAFLEGPITRLFSCKNENVRKIAWIHNDISQVFGQGIKSKIKKYLDENTYKKYNDLVFVSKDNLDKFNETYKKLKITEEHKKVIYNYIDSKRIIEKSQEKIETNFEKNVINFVSVARLVKQKGIDRLIKIHSKLIKSGYKHNIYIIGDGPEKGNLEELIKQEKVEKTFCLLGQKENPYPYIKNADYFCLFSRYEGYGMVLEEAKILNKNIVITNTAAREAVENYGNKWILENTNEGIYSGLVEIINKKTKDMNLENKKIETQYDNLETIKKVKELIGD